MSASDHLHILTLPFVPPEAVLDRFMAQDHAAGFLSDGGTLGRWSWLCLPVPVDRLEATDPRAPAELLTAAAEAILGPPPVINGDYTGDLPPFTGGLIGLAAYELGLRLENLSHRPFSVDGDTQWPDLWLGQVQALAAFDLHEKRLMVLGRGTDPNDARAQAQALVSLLRAAPDRQARPPAKLMDGPLQSETPDALHEARVAEIVTRIHAGDLFQANLTRGWRGKLAQGVTPAHLLQALMAAGPSPFGAFVRTGDRVIVSNSPERFIRLDQDRRLETRPIKGTRPRGDTPASDAAQAQALLSSDKDRAENLMIVDLMRHDLSKVAETGSVRVEALYALETYPNVHHLVSTVTARLKAGQTAADVLLNTFPPGSITGAPKVQAMKVIDALEDGPRGPYCGALFWVDASGAMDSSVLIRTAACEADREGGWALRLCAGGGIVADSDPEDERRETETKLSLFRRVLKD